MYIKRLIALHGKGMSGTASITPGADGTRITLKGSGISGGLKAYAVTRSGTIPFSLDSSLSALLPGTPDIEAILLAKDRAFILEGVLSGRQVDLEGIKTGIRAKEAQQAPQNRQGRTAGASEPAEPEKMRLGQTEASQHGTFARAGAQDKADESCEAETNRLGRAAGANEPAEPEKIRPVQTEEPRHGTFIRAGAAGENREAEANRQGRAAGASEPAEPEKRRPVQKEGPRHGTFIRAGAADKSREAEANRQDRAAGASAAPLQGNSEALKNILSTAKELFPGYDSPKDIGPGHAPESKTRAKKKDTPLSRSDAAWQIETDSLLGKQLPIPEDVGAFTFPNPFPANFPLSRWRRVYYTGTKRYYLEGECLTDKGRFMIYALPGSYSPVPPMRQQGFVKFLRAADGSGFWLKIVKK